MCFEIDNKREQILKNKQILIDKFYRKDSIRYVMGINEWTDKLILYCKKNGLDIHGIIDDYTKEKNYNNFPIYKIEDVKEEDVLVISCIIYGRIVSANNNLKNKNISNILNYLDLCLVDEELDVINYCKDNKYDIEHNREKYLWLYNTLIDKKSKETLKNIIDFRYNFNIEAMTIFKYNLTKQYFDDFIKLNDEEIFVDCGGFNGESTKKFISLCPNYNSIYYFEPIKEYLKESQEKLNQYKNIYYFCNGTYKDNCILSFSSKGSESNISEEGKERIEVVKLDDVINDKVTYIKMDVEGAEYDSLIGCEKLIKAYKPKLAVCVYHKQKDFWRIPELVLQYNPNYKVYLRHYTEGMLETVMYFI